MKSARGVVLAAAVVATATAAQSSWPWTGGFDDKAVTLLILGDIQIHSRRSDPMTAFVNLRETLQRADLVYANLEGTLVPSQGSDGDIPDKNGWTHPGQSAPAVLKASNIKVVGLANNVAYGRKNIVESMRVLEAQGIAHTGAGRNLDQAHKPAIVERKGVKFGFLQYTARWYREDEQIATATAPGVARMLSRDGVTIDAGDLDRMRTDVRKLRSQVDVVVVSHHNRDGGTPVQFAPASPAPRGQTRPDRTRAEEYQKQFARAALDTGADLVFGHGTHTVQGVEVYKGKPILYAIGHSAFDQPGYEDSKDGFVIRSVVQNKQVARVSFVPVTRDAQNNVLLLDPSDGEGARLLGIVKGVSPGATLRIDGKEVVLLDRAARSTTTR
jgi:poly-gamma-glutamate capsule biosynthesis protein CapA/YwtB (metallophosphatase superfamily)